MVPPGAEQLHHRGVRRLQKGRDELRAGQEQGAEDAVDLQPDAHRKLQEPDDGPVRSLLSQLLDHRTHRKSEGTFLTTINH